MSKWVWTLVEGTVVRDEDWNEYNPEGFWLGNKDTNEIFILPEDFETVRALLNARAPAPPAVPVVAEMKPECTGTSAQWCPVCGDCTCPRDEDGDCAFDDARCLLHGPRSKHADQDAIPSQCGSGPPYGCPGCGGMICANVNDRWQLEPRSAAVPPPGEGSPPAAPPTALPGQETPK